VLKNLALRVPSLRRLYDDRADLRTRLEAAQKRGADQRTRLKAVQKRNADLRTRLKAAQKRSPFWHYTSTFNAVKVMKRYAVEGLEPSAGYLTNFLGVRIDPKFFPDILEGRGGEVEPIPIPANWHADIAEWGAALRSVDLSNETFTMIELGCGWGCWMNNTGLAARSVGRTVHLIGVEGDEGHIEFARESLSTNGFEPEMFTLHHGIAAAEEGVALFPRQETSGVAWGLEPVFGATEHERDAAVAAGSHDVLQMVPLSKLAAPYPRIDLLHIDIQGGEADLVEGCLPLLQEKFAYLLIGTHSKQIEGRLYELLIAAGWRLEMERAAMFNVVDGVPYVAVDGVQGWRNTALLPA
jgi:hypothetical protein